MKFLKTLSILSLSLICVACNGFKFSDETLEKKGKQLGELAVEAAKDPKLTELRKKLIGTWAYTKDPASYDIFFFTEDYYVFIRPYKNINYKGKEPLLYSPPSKYNYRIGKNFSYYYALLPSLLTDLAFKANSAFGSYYVKSPYPVKIVESLFDDSITLENAKNSFRKLKESEVLELLKDYDIDYELLAKEKIKGTNLGGNLSGPKEDDSIPHIMQEYIRINNIDITKKSGRLGVSQQDDGPHFIKMKEDFAKFKAEEEKFVQETEYAIKHIKEEWNFPSLEEVKKSAKKAMVQSKGHRQLQREGIENNYKKNSIAMLLIKDYLPAEKPLGIFTYQGRFADNYRTIAVFEDKIITCSLRNAYSSSKKIESHAEAFDVKYFTYSQNTKFQNLLSVLKSNNEALKSHEGAFFGNGKVTLHSAMFSILDNATCHTFCVQDVYFLEESDMAFIAYNALNDLYKSLHNTKQ